MFEIWQGHTASPQKFKSAFDALTYMQDHAIEGKVRNSAGNTIAKIDIFKWKDDQITLGIPEAATILERSNGRLRQLCNQGRLGQKSARGNWLITLDNLKDFAAQERLSGVGIGQTIRKKETE